jgi:peptide-methionine (R)-S-oxide reductase
MYRMFLIGLLLAGFSFEACLQSNGEHSSVEEQISFVDAAGDTIHPVQKSEEEWKQELDASAYHVLREKGTERAFTGKFNKFKQAGVYTCNACGLSLFSSDAKFNSGTGWPSFFKPLDETHILEVTDSSHGMKRVEVLCRRCGGHLGHVFEDGPKPTGMRYCLNSVSLAFEPEGDSTEE